jgi:hypothetical protein
MAKSTIERDQFFLDLVVEGVINVSKDGIVVNNITAKEIGFITGGYKRINMFGKTYPVHRLVYMVHIDYNIPDGYVINHIDGDKLNNRYENLEAITEHANARHSVDVLGIKYGEHLKELDVSGANNGMSKLTDEQVLKYRTLYDTYQISKQEIIKETGMLVKAVVQMLNSKTYTNVPYRISRSTRKHS